jgi:hypothetical protein
MSHETQPLVTASDLTYLGSFTLPNTDGTGTPGDSDLLQYGGYGLGIGASNTLYYGCYAEADTIARVTIPAIGATASIVTPCQVVPNLKAIDSFDGGAYTLGGTLWWNGRLILSAHAYYDADIDAVASHFYGPSVTGLLGPVTLTDGPPGIKGGSMVKIPDDWQSDMGGPALTGLWGVSIVSRSSYGPSFSSFDPDDVGVVDGVPSTTLCRYTNTTQFTTNFWEGVGIGSLAWPSGYRSVLCIQSVGTGTPCYGTGGASGGTCYDPARSANGYHAYPYVLRVYVYDANDLALVQTGALDPWQVLPSTYFDLFDPVIVSGAAEFRSAAYDDTTRRWYIVGQAGGNQPRVHVYEVAEAVEPPVGTPPGTGMVICG